MGNYTLVTTSEMGENNLPKEPGRINGGFFQKTQENQHPSVVIAVDDIRDAMKRVAESGGPVIGGRRRENPTKFLAWDCTLQSWIRKATGYPCCSRCP